MAAQTECELIIVGASGGWLGAVGNNVVIVTGFELELQLTIFATRTRI